MAKELIRFKKLIYFLLNIDFLTGVSGVWSFSRAKTLIVNEKPFACENTHCKRETQKSMQSLLHKPNLLFLIFVRNQNRALLLSKLRRPIYRIKLIKALTTIVKENGSQSWLINGKYHREDGPAMIDADGSQYWYQNGNLHREDGPAYIGADGIQEWLINGKCHREDGPAIIGTDGTQYWFKNGKVHREDGPAYIGPDGTQAWYLNGNRHW